MAFGVLFLIGVEGDEVGGFGEVGPRLVQAPVEVAADFGLLVGGGERGGYDGSGRGGSEVRDRDGGGSGDRGKNGFLFRFLFCLFGDHWCDNFRLFDYLTTNLFPCVLPFLGLRRFFLFRLPFFGIQLISTRSIPQIYRLNNPCNLTRPYHFQQPSDF